MNSYVLIRPPIPLQFHERSRTELEAYGTWFHDVIPKRIAELTRAVNHTRGYERWDPDTTPDSLNLLGQWFESQVEPRKKSPEEIESTRVDLPYSINIPEEELTDKSFSLAMDIGVYFAEVFLKHLNGVRWDQPLKNKKFADYGQPVIVGTGTVPLNPVRVIVMTAYGICRKKPAHLRELYDIWAKMLR